MNISDPTKKKYTLSKRFNRATIQIVVLILIMFFTIIFTYDVSKYNAKLRDRLTYVSNIAKVSLPSAVWNLDEGIVKDISKRPARHAARSAAGSSIGARLAWAKSFMAAASLRAFKHRRKRPAGLRLRQTIDVRRGRMRAIIRVGHRRRQG